MSMAPLSNDGRLGILKAISNETRLNILCWLRDAEGQFPLSPEQVRAEFPGGVCVGSIQDKSGLTQSVISSYLASMQKAGLLESRRFGQWTYYRRNEAAIRAFLADLAAELEATE
ncbi:ArsR/SmtB family transcription factor [Paenibacillus albicereus]|nr:metalloregulator ArsR/SmtB family transcription factor [Paenibacillus albicereus]